MLGLNPGLSGFVWMSSFGCLPRTQYVQNQIPNLPTYPHSVPPTALLLQSMTTSDFQMLRPKTWSHYGFSLSQPISKVSANLPILPSKFMQNSISSHHNCHGGPNCHHIFSEHFPSTHNYNYFFWFCLFSPPDLFLRQQLERAC